MLRKIILDVAVNALAIAITAWLLPGIEVVNNDVGTYLILGFVFGLLNAIVWPLMTCLTCALILLTMGLFLLVINGMALWLTAELLPERLIIDNFWWAMLGGLVMAVVGTFFKNQLGLNDQDKDA